MATKFSDPAEVKGVISQELRGKWFIFINTLIDTFQIDNLLCNLDIGGKVSHWEMLNYKDDLVPGVSQRNNLISSS